MTDQELDELLAELNADVLAELNRLCSPEWMEQRLREVMLAAGYDPDAPAATSAETKIQP